MLPAITTAGTAPACAGVPTFDESAAVAMTWNASSDATSGLNRYDTYIAGALIGTTAAPGLSYSTSAVAAGGHAWREVAFDNFGLQTNATPNPLTVRFDKIAPAAAAVTPANASFTNNTTPTLTWTASDDNCVARVEIWVDGVKVATGGGGETTYAIPTALTEGSHTWQVKAIDTMNRVTASGINTFMVDTTAPTGVTAVNPPNAGTVPEQNMTSQWTAGTDGAGSGVNRYDLYVDGTLRTSGILGLSQGTFAIFPGAHNWKIRAYDAVGNFADFTFTYTATAVPDVTPPNTFNLLTPANGATVVNGSLLTWEAAYDFHGIAQYLVMIDGFQTGAVPGTQTNFTLSAGAGAPICTVDFDPATNAGGCVDAFTALAAWTISGHAGNTTSSNGLGIDNFEGNMVSTNAQYTVHVPTTGANLVFDHHYDFSATMAGANVSSAWDGGTVQVRISTDGGATFPAIWKNTCGIGAKSVYGTSLKCDYEVMQATNGYKAVLANGSGNPLALTHVFSGPVTGMVRSTMRLSAAAFQGKTIQVRFIAGMDSCWVGMPGSPPAAYDPNSQYGFCTSGGNTPKKANWSIDNVTLSQPALALGAHSWNIIAVDPAGNQRPSTQTWGFTLM
ncbi:MAG: Ig-like domain-containing protein [Thermoleophilia bacterium]|nr:Ig-like domain-containing protein [Thermoleophilia bacterium]